MIKRNYVKFALIFIYAVGAISGVAWALYCKAWFPAVCCAVVDAIAFPQVSRWFKEIMM